MRTAIGVMLFVSLAGAQQFNEALLQTYMVEQNRHIKAMLADNRVAKEQITIADGAFDVTTSGKYETKEYPSSVAEYSDVGIGKRFENGLNFYSGYRQASGTQEYNNIKTGKDGEFIATLQLPIVEFLQGMNEQRFTLKNAELGLQSQKLQTQFAMQSFYLKILQSYYTMLQFKERLDFRGELLSKSRQREAFIDQKVSEGYFPKISNLEAHANTLNYEQQYQEMLTAFEQEKLNLCYLLDTSCELLFKEKVIPKMPHLGGVKQSAEELFSGIGTKRADLQKMSVDADTLKLQQKLNAVKKLPSSQLSFSSVYDQLYGDGYKVSASLQFPLARSAYRGKRQELQIRHNRLKAQRELLENSIRTGLAKLTTQSINLGKIEDSKLKQIDILEQLLKAEEIRFSSGEGTLLTLVQREMMLLNNKEKLLLTRLKQVLTHKEISFFTGDLYYLP